MRLLLIDCGSEHLGQLESVCAKHHLTVITSVELTSENVDNYDALVIAGNSIQSGSDAGGSRSLLQLVTSLNKPLLGIGFGFEVICYGLGAQLDRLGIQGIGAPIITPTDDGSKVFQGTDPMRAKDVERWLVDAEDLPKILLVLATSESGIEAVKHKTKPIYGLQLFPEQFAYPSDGKLVLENILASFTKLAKPPRVMATAQ